MKYSRVKTKDLDKMMRYVEKLENDLFKLDIENTRLKENVSSLEKANSFLEDENEELSKSLKSMKVKEMTDRAMLEKCLEIINSVDVSSMDNASKRFSEFVNKLDVRA